MKRLFHTLARVAAVAVSALVLLVTIEMAWGDVNAIAVARRAQAMEHPSQSRHVKGMAVVKNVGGSNDCTWVGGEFRSSSLSRQDIEDFYASSIVSSYETPNKTLELHFYGDEGPYGQIHEFMNNLDRLATANPKETMYLVLATDGLHHAGFDVRCF